MGRTGPTTGLSRMQHAITSSTGRPNNMGRIPVWKKLEASRRTHTHGCLRCPGPFDLELWARIYRSRMLSVSDSWTGLVHDEGGWGWE